MGLKSYQLVLAAGAQRLSVVYGGASAGGAINAAQDIPYRQLLLSAEGADAFIGMDNLTTSSVYGTKVDSSENLPVTLGPFDTGPIHLSDYWVAGSGSTLHVTGIPF